MADVIKIKGAREHPAKNLLALMVYIHASQERLTGQVM